MPLRVEVSCDCARLFLTELKHVAYYRSRILEMRRRLSTVGQELSRVTVEQRQKASWNLVLYVTRLVGYSGGSPVI